MNVSKAYLFERMRKSWKGIYFHSFTFTYTKPSIDELSDMIAYTKLCPPGTELYYVIEHTKNGMPHLHGVIRTTTSKLPTWPHAIVTRPRRMFKKKTNLHLDYFGWVHYIFKKNSVAVLLMRPLTREPLCTIPPLRLVIRARAKTPPCPISRSTLPPLKS